MRTIVSCILGFLCAAGLAGGGARAANEVPPAPAEASPADRAFAQIKAIVAERNPSADAGANPCVQLQWAEAHAAKLAAAVQGFFDAYPADSRRWDAFMRLRDLQRRFVTGIKLQYCTDPTDENLIIDREAKTAWERRIARLTAAMQASPDATESQKTRLAVRELTDEVRLLGGGQRMDPADIEAKMAAFEARHPDSAAAINLRLSLGSALEKTNIAAARGYYETLSTHENEGVRSVALGRLHLLALRSTPMNLKFTAADGRQVDVGSLRGKVVLIDFWATWCGPCKAEIPNIVASYGKYHDRGFEVIGISLENAHLQPGDTSAAAAAGLERARKRLADFTAVNAMPWPQYFDGKYWKNDLALRFGIRSIPAMLLLDREGRLMSTAAHGPKLEAEIRRLLNQ